MILISHRGNINGKIPEYENNPDYVDSAINLGYEVQNMWGLGTPEDLNFYLENKIIK